MQSRSRDLQISLAEEARVDRGRASQHVGAGNEWRVLLDAGMGRVLLSERALLPSPGHAHRPRQTRFGRGQLRTSVVGSPSGCPRRDATKSMLDRLELYGHRCVAAWEAWVGFGDILHSPLELYQKNAIIGQSVRNRGHMTLPILPPIPWSRHRKEGKRRRRSS